ncbi:MAG: hypothetical protein J5906_07195, partial [Acidaminococcaceae bacterium]|nr:hypothetical protein [Acidaminococcaceae bacterium]
TGSNLCPVIVAAFWQPFVRGYAPLFGLPKQTTTNLSAVIATCYCNLRFFFGICIFSEQALLEITQQSGKISRSLFNPEI